MIAFLLPLVLMPLATAPQAQREPEPSEERVVRGRLLDALTGVPVEGASCELWSEDFDAPMELVDSVASRCDGSFALLDPRRMGEKVRVRKRGYRSTVFAGEDEVFLFPLGEPFVFRVQDLDGRPIVGARVRSHQTCQHGPAAVEGTSGWGGRVVLPDAPPFEDGPEYEVRAKGYGAVTQLDWSLFTNSFAAPEDFAVRLPRRAPVKLRLLDADGSPLAHRRFRQQGLGHLVFTTDADGRAVLESMFESREIGLEECVKGGGGLHLSGWPALEGECTLQVGRPAPRDGAPDENGPVLVMHAEKGSTVHVQYGDDSVTLEIHGDPEEVPVRPGVPVTVRSEQGGWHFLEAVTGRTDVDFVSASEVFREWSGKVEKSPEGRRPPWEVPLRYSLASDSGASIEVSATLRWPREKREDEDPTPTEVLFHVLRNELWEVCLRADGHVPRFRQGRAGSPVTETIVLERRARVECRGACESIELAGQVRSSADGEGWNTLELAPGWAQGMARFSGGRELRIDRALAPGELLVIE